MVAPRTGAELVPPQGALSPTDDGAGQGGPSRSPAERAYRVRLLCEEVDADTGVRLRRLAVEDESQESPTRESTHAMFGLLDDLLLAHPEWRAPTVTDGEVLTHGNPTGEWIYGSATMREWRRELVPSAMALYPVQRPVSHLPSGAPLDTMAHRVFRDSLDGIGIRSRARIMGDVVRGATQAHRQRGGSRASWVSLACGAAVPVLDALAELGHGCVELRLVDLDPDALAFAAELATAQGLTEGTDYTLMQRNLVRSIVAGTSLLDEIGEGQATVVEALGIFEYFTDASCVKLLRNAYRLLHPDGVLVIGNMLDDRRQLQFNQRAAGWPHLVPRSVERLVELVERAGLPLDRTTVSIPEDGVYAVLHVVR